MGCGASTTTSVSGAPSTTSSGSGVPSKPSPFYNDANELRREISVVGRTFPRVKMDGPGTMKVKGFAGVFNCAPPLNESWLGGVLTPDQFTGIVNQVNEGTVQALLGAKKVFDWLDLPGREQKIFNHMQEKVRLLNETWNSKGVKIAVDEGQPIYNLVMRTKGSHLYANTKQLKRQHFLYISINTH
mmetsp:Transcript_62740/g.72981  ORF Transcript_62740/g.72981 Transcript_62740/m.72981 type:complete len:186 (-) Transcript_62740:153-710(-)